MPTFDTVLDWDPPIVWEDDALPPVPPDTSIPVVTSDDILDLNGINVRADRFVFDLLDQFHTRIGTLDVGESTAPTITVNTTRSATRALTNMLLYLSDLDDIDPIRDRVAPALILQNGDRWPLGVYMFGQDNESPFSWGDTIHKQPRKSIGRSRAKTPELVDETFLVDQPLDYTASANVGDSIIGLINQLLAPVVLPTVVIEAVDQAATSPLAYRVGTGRYAALAALAGLLGCYPPFFDNAGNFIFKQAPAPTDLSVDHTYSAGGRILDGTTTISSTAYRAPNRYQVIGDDPAAPVVGIYDLPASAPHSQAQTGRIVTTSRNMQGLASVDIANVAAYVDALTDHNTYGTVAFSSTADPRHDTYDRVDVLGVRYLETGWTLECRSGGAMTHQGTQLWQ